MLRFCILIYYNCVIYKLENIIIKEVKFRVYRFYKAKIKVVVFNKLLNTIEFSLNYGNWKGASSSLVSNSIIVARFLAIVKILCRNMIITE